MLEFFLAVGASAVPFAFLAIFIALVLDAWLRHRQSAPLGRFFWSALLIGTVVGLICLWLSLAERMTAG